MGAVITSIQEIDVVLSVVMDMSIRLVEGEVGFIMLEENGKLVHKIAWGVSETVAHSLTYLDNLDIPTYCFQNLEPLVLGNLNRVSEGGIKVNSIIAMPIMMQDRCFGVAAIINKDSGTNFVVEDKENLAVLLNFVAVAIDNSLLVKDKLRKQQIEQEMAIARQVQATILPQDIAAIPGVEVGAMYFPARDVGGDFYDLIRINDTKFIAIIGDVSNKGVPAALVMSACSGIIKSIVAAEPAIEISSLANRVNEILAREIIRDREMFVTLFFCCIDLEAKQLTYCNGGHLPGLLWINAKKRVQELAKGGPILGQFHDNVFQQGTVKLQSDDRLFLFTDGLSEASDIHNNLFGRERVLQVFMSDIELSPSAFCKCVKDWVDLFSAGTPEESHDDFTILQIRIQ